MCRSACGNTGPSLSCSRCKEVAGYVLTNLSLCAPNFRAGSDLELGCYRLFDVSYSDPAGADLLQDSIEQEGRRIALRLRIRR